MCFLQKAYAKFGSWTLVAASYNGGQGRVDRNMNQQYQSNYYDLLFGEETGRYVYRILAIKTILNSPQQYGFNIDSLSVYPTFESSPIMVDSTIDDIAQWAVEQGTSYKNVKRFNPWLRQNKLTVAKGKSYSIYLPLIADTMGHARAIMIFYQTFYRFTLYNAHLHIVFFKRFYQLVLKIECNTSNKVDW